MLVRRPGIALLLLAVLWLCGSLVAHAAGADDRASQLKAAYLFNFLKFVQWPETQQEGAVQVCFIGSSTVERALAGSIEGKKAGGRDLLVREIDPGQSTQGCSMLFIDAQAIQSVSPLPPANPAAPMLTVSDATGFMHVGGMIELFTQNNRLHFNVNIETARRAGLTISSSLLQLASSVEKVGAP